MAIDYAAQGNLDYIDMNLADPAVKPWDGTSSRLPPGEYEFEIKTAGRDQSRKGNPVLVLENEVVNECEQKGRTMRATFTLMTDSNASRQRLKNLTEACGVPLDDRGGFSSGALVGARYAAIVVHEEYSEMNTSTGQQETRTAARIQGEMAIPGAVKQAPPPQAGRRPTANGPAAGARRP